MTWQWCIVLMTSQHWLRYTSHYLNQCLPGFMSSYYLTDIRSRWVNRCLFDIWSALVHAVAWYRTGHSLLSTWWRHQMETFFALLAICAGNSAINGEFPAQRPVARSFDVFVDLHRNKRLSKQSWGWWLETPSHPLWRHCNVKLDAETGMFRDN